MMKLRSTVDRHGAGSGRYATCAKQGGHCSSSNPREHLPLFLGNVHTTSGQRTDPILLQSLFAKLVSLASLSLPRFFSHCIVQITD